MTGKQVQPHKGVKDENGKYKKEPLGYDAWIIGFGQVNELEGDGYTTGIFVDQEGFLNELPLDLLKEVY